MRITRAFAVMMVALAVAVPSGAVAKDTVGGVDPTQGLWHLRAENGTESNYFFGNPGDYPVMGDWDCDGIDTPGMYRQTDGYVYLRNSNTQGPGDVRFFFGDPGDIPIVGDFNGDGCDTVSIFRPSEGRAFIINELGQDEGGLGAAEFSYYFGNPGDKPFVGDFDGDAVDTIGLHRESTGFVYFRNSHTEGIADNSFFFGDPGDRFVAGDWTGAGIDTPGLFRPSAETYYFRYTNTPGNADAQLVWGVSNWLPVAGTFGPLPPPVCDPAYPTICVPPPPPDLNCNDIVPRDFKVLPPDPHDFDRDGDGIGCETIDGYLEDDDSAPPPPNCHPSYPDFCIPPPPPDLNCSDIPQKNFTVLPPDPHNFDGNKDGIGCET